jgi:hypothetical protein
VLDDGDFVFQHACKLGLEGIISKRKNSHYRSGRSPGLRQAEESEGARSEARGGRGLGGGAEQDRATSLSPRKIESFPLPRTPCGHSGERYSIIAASAIKLLILLEIL